MAAISATAQNVEVAFPNLSFNVAVDLQNAGDGTDRLFAVEQPGTIKVFANSPQVASATVFLDIEDRVLSDDRFGMLGLAFHPEYETNGFFFVHYTAPDPARSVIARYSVDPQDPQRADVASEVVLLEVGQPHRFHNGGALAFGPDGYLYVPLGDGGPGRDPNNHGQNRATLLGSVLRIDVDETQSVLNYAIPPDNPFVGNTDGFREEIWAWGFRNPWRISFDAATGGLWAGENGEDSFEEIDIVEAGKNYGWKIMEGSECFFPGIGCDMTGLELPVWEYGGTLQRRSVIGGYVYHGSRNPELRGRYIYGDFLVGRIWALDLPTSGVATNTQVVSGVGGISTFGIDEAGEIYFSNILDGKIYRFAPTSTGVANVAVPPVSRMSSSYPNPFQESARISFTMRRSARVRLDVFDMLGRRVRILLDGVVAPGSHLITWDGRDEFGQRTAGGTYVIRLATLDHSESRVLLRHY